MRILHVVHQYPPEYIGGVELNTQWVANGQIGQGNDVAVFYRRSAEGSGIERWQEENGVQVWAAYNGEVEPTSRFLATFREESLLEYFKQALSHIQPDIIHIQHLMGLPTAIIKLLQQQALPYVITLHDYWWVCANAQLLTNDTDQVCDGPQRWINCGRCALARAGMPSYLKLAPIVAPIFASRHFLLRRLMQNASRLIVPTAFTKEIYVKLGIIGEEEIEIIPNGIKLSNNRCNINCRTKVNNKLQIAYAGGIAHQKGVHILLQAVCKLPLDCVELTLYGDLEAFPDYTTMLREQASANVKFVGRVPNEELLSRLADADVLVVPSLWYETAGLVIQEAFSVGIPVIASNIGALTYRIRHEIDGLHFPPGDWQALRDILLRIVDDPSLLLQLRTNIEMKDTIENQVKKIESVYIELLKKLL